MVGTAITAIIGTQHLNGIQKNGSSVSWFQSMKRNAGG